MECGSELVPWQERLRRRLGLREEKIFNFIRGLMDNKITK
jgi:hypothetical protein